MTYNKGSREEIIKKSHERSQKYGIKKEQVVSKRILKGQQVVENIKNNQELIRTADAFMKIIYDFLVGSGFFIILTDKDGCILNIIGDKGILDAARDMDMVIGAYMDERSIGTNAMGIAISEDVPIQVSATEHFVTAYHKWTCSAAIIHDENANIIGTLNLTGNSKLVHPHTLGLVVAAVKSIESQINSEKVQNELVKSYSYMNTVMNSMDYGIIAIDINGVVRNINMASCAMLKIVKEEIMNNSIEKILDNWKYIFNQVKEGKHYHDEEIVLIRQGVRERYALSAYAIKVEKNDLIGMVLTIKEIQRVLNLVNKYTGGGARYVFGDIIGESSLIKNVIDNARNIASSPSTVLIEGESGTGKEVLAQSIHNASNRKNNSFVAINCGAIPKNLIESELFGYEDCAFTGAKRGGMPGKFELANGGTLFLDEIGEMPLDMQVNLLRVLQEGSVTRIGSSRYIPIDVRIIAATNKELRREIDKGTFRCDLYYRLSVIPIFLPPLRDREEDIMILFKHFLGIKAEKLRKPIPSISDEIYSKIFTYNWPGNIREIENFVENIVNLDGNTTFDIENKQEGVGCITKCVNKISDEEQFICSLEELEKKAIIASIKKFDGNITKIARVLGISRNTLYVKIKKYCIHL
ncbi:sigma-54-dependent Fis family transcriptional regulator [Clostridium sp. CF012]|uniref:sigma-54-dependent Fis family transcriptional regulator n=1 Tax=Clostridium sp. CF012 TaxID=2843319 RepID=UPI001C0E4C64|nr:sigma 54-interacting transcriptional regulator [Clostridium sp. CF012]MBU3146418.1 sigma 54-interacting transcriptional regulator [Clostridium sp. CF012]